MQYIRSLKNFRAEQPHQHAVYYTTVLFAEQCWTKEELLEATEGMSGFEACCIISTVSAG